MKAEKSFCPPVLNRRVLIGTLQVIESEGGQRLEDFTYMNEVWASIEPLESEEVLSDERLALIKRHRFVLRYQENLTAAHRFKWNERYFSIVRLLDPDERQRWLIAETEELSL